MIKINKKHLIGFEKIKKKFLNKTKVPTANNWKNKTNDKIWWEIVKQVMVVQSSKAAEKFNKSQLLKNKISYKNLHKFNSDKKLKNIIQEVLVAVGTRIYNKKTDALIYNFKKLRDVKGGPKNLLRIISKINGKEKDYYKIKFLLKSNQKLKYIGDKGVRDLLMELGLIRNAIALDSRVQKIFKKVGIILPEGFETNPRLYDEIEKDILENLCKPLKLTGVQFDRIIYQNYDEIKNII